MLQLWTCNQGISDNQKAFNWPLRHRNGEESFERKLKAENIPVAFKTPFYFSWWSLHLILFRGFSPKERRCGLEDQSKTRLHLFHKYIFVLFDSFIYIDLLRCLQALFIHFILSVLLIACCGNMTKHAIDWGKAYKNVYKSYKPNVLALLIGLVSRIQLLQWSVVSCNFGSSAVVK